MPPKHLFVDWSGDLGFKFGRGSTTHLVIAVVRVADYTAFRKAIAALRAERGLHKGYEFHYAHIPEAERAAFFAALREASFEAWVLVVDKRELSAGFRRRNQYDLFSEFVVALVDHLPEEAVENGRVVVDTHSTTMRLTRTIRVAMSRALRTREIQPGIKRVRGRPAHREDGLQLADMLAGAVVEARVKGGEDYLVGLEDQIYVLEFEEGDK
ncbi:DUF3800 domain-containing protein [Candidatus Parcubacteria bacterium]|nr:MAG: DUF3800 domain-containing protein [Candidatus Parcubacteria bacterium]